jgi:hypothetical protein
LINNIQNYKENVVTEKTQNICKIEGERNTVFAESVPYLLKTTKKKRKEKVTAYIPASVMFSHNTKHKESINVMIDCLFFVKIKRCKLLWKG